MPGWAGAGLGRAGRAAYAERPRASDYPEIAAEIHPSGPPNLHIATNRLWPGTVVAICSTFMQNAPDDPAGE